MKPTLAVLVCLSGLVATAAGAGPKFELRDGDRVVLIGDALIERDQEYGYLETLLTLQDPDMSITFRNLGWSGDTVFGDARAGFGTQADGFAHLKEHVLALKPTVVIVGYGMTDSFAGEAGLPRFVEGLNTLLDVIAETKARVVLLSPITHEDLGRPLPDPTKHNRDLALYRDAIGRVATKRGHAFLDLIKLRVGDGMKTVVPFPETDDGIILNGYGYWQFSAAVELGLNLSGRAHWDVQLNRVTPDSKWSVGLWTLGTDVSDVEPVAVGVRFKSRDESLPNPTAPKGTPRTLVARDRRLKVDGLEPGQYILKIDGAIMTRASSEQWRNGVRLDHGPERDQVERLRKAINEKNRLYFYRWRPQNETYLFGFRKKEQGNNAREIPMFDPLVDAKEAEIATLKKPVSHVYELIREGEVGR